MRGTIPAVLAMLTLALAASGLPPVPRPKEDDAAAKLARAVKGTWEAVKRERGGPRKVGDPPGYVYRVTIDGAKLTQTTFLDGRELPGIPSTFTLDARKSPAGFVMSYTLGSGIGEVKTRGVLTVEGDTMIWAFASGDAAVPAKIDGKLAQGQSRFTLKRLKK